MNSARSLAPSREKSRTKGSSAPAAVFSDWAVGFSDKPNGFSKTGSPSLGIVYAFVFVSASLIVGSFAKSFMGSFSSYLSKMLFSFSLMFCSFLGVWGLRGRGRKGMAPAGGRIWGYSFPLPFYYTMGVD